jgi:neuroligin
MLIKLSSSSSAAVCSFVIVAALILEAAFAAHADLYKNARLGTRIVQTRYGRLQGLVLPLDNFKFLKPVEVFLAVPYATPPTRQNR